MLSNVPASMYLPLGENFTKDTGGFSSSGGAGRTGGAVNLINTYTSQGGLYSRVLLQGIAPYIMYLIKQLYIICGY